MSIVGTATRDGMTSSSNTLTDDQIRMQLDAPDSQEPPETPSEPPAEPAPSDPPQEPTEPPAESEPAPPPVEAKARKKDPTKDPETRISKATYEREEAKREAARERAERERIQKEFDAFRAQTQKPAEQPAPKAQPAGEPKLEDFADQPDPYASYLRALARHDLAQELAQREKQALEARTKDQQEQTARQREQAEQARIASFGQKLQQALAADPNLEALMAASDIEITRPMADAIIESDAPEKLIAHLHANRDDVARIRELSPLQQFRALARLDAQLESPAASGLSGTQAPKKTSAQPPIRPVGGARAVPASGPPDPATCTQEEFDAYYNKQDQEARKAGRR